MHLKKHRVYIIYYYNFFVSIKKKTKTKNCPENIFFFFIALYSCTSFRCYHILYYIRIIYIYISILLSLCLKSNYRVYILYVYSALQRNEKTKIIYKSWSAHNSRPGCRRGVCSGRNEHVVFRAEILNDLKTALCKYSSTTHIYLTFVGPVIRDRINQGNFE